MGSLLQHGERHHPLPLVMDTLQRRSVPPGGVAGSPLAPGAVLSHPGPHGVTAFGVVPSAGGKGEYKLEPGVYEMSQVQGG